MIRALRRLSADPLDVLAALRGRRGLMGLVGAWAGGGALIGSDPVTVLGEDDDPFGALGTYVPDGTMPPSFLGGGWFGWWGYQLGRRLERLPAPPPRPVPQRAHWLARYEWLLRADRDGRWWFESLLPEARAERVLQRLREDLRPGRMTAQPYRFGGFTMTPAPDRHVAAVARAVDHIGAGDVFQANVCARLEAAFAGDPLDVFGAGVRRLAPAYAAFFDTGERAVASFSPELFLQRRGRSVRTAPIKGTASLASGRGELEASAKDRAENVMIVDLMRNDLGRVCEPGSITVPVLARAEGHVGVWHLVSEVTGTLAGTMTDADLMRACFPPGSVTGAPKVRAMELINELEATGREAYTGAIGYAGPAGLETSVAIRTLEFGAGRAWLGVGGGVVADSDPHAELAECLTKARPLLDAVGARLAVPPVREPLLATGPAHPGPPFPRLAGPPPDPRAGVFTTLLVRDGVPVLADAHLERLTASATALGLAHDRAELVRGLAAAATGAGARRVRIALGVRRVEVTAAGIPHGPEPAWRLAPVVRPGGLGAHKWADRGVLDAAAVSGEPLVLDEGGEVLETARANVFVVADDGVHTPPADGRILPGIARAAVLGLLRDHGIPARERALRTADLAAAAEVFVTNAVRGVVPVSACAGVGTWAVGPTTAWLRSTLYDEWHGRRRAGIPAAPVAPARVLLVDNYDSFSYNLAQYVRELGAGVEVVRNDARTVDDLVAACAAGAFSHVIVSPGPGHPDDAGISVDLVRRVGGCVPVLGVCLGHQAVARAYGARVTRARRPVHGTPALVHHDGRGVFAGIDGPLAAARYHSLAVADVPGDLVVTARTADGTVMGIRHRRLPVEGLQVHPESILTPHGHRLVRSFLATSATGVPDLPGHHG